MSQQFDEVDVLARLPGQSETALAGQALHDGDAVSYHYDRKYLTQPNEIPLFTADLPLSLDRLHHTTSPPWAARRDCADARLPSHLIMFGDVDAEHDCRCGQ